jgi:polyribonucleotide nucleotidyltransferase
MLREGAKSDVMFVAKDQHKLVIGSGGATIRSLREQTGVEIQVPQPTDENEFITIIGSESQIAAAKSVIATTLAQIQQQRDREREKRQREYQAHTGIGVLCMLRRTTMVVSVRFSS